MKKISLDVDKRDIFGRKLKHLRSQGVLPANLFGKKIKSLALKVDLKNFLTVYKQAGETSIVELIVGKNKEPHSVLIHGLQYHPVTDLPLHVDFRQIDLKEKVQVAIPIDIVGAAPGVTKGGVLVIIMDEVEIEALPADLPEKFTVDISSLEEVGQFIAVKDLKVDKDKIKLLVADENQLIVKVDEPAKEEVEEKPAEAVEEGAEAKTEEQTVEKGAEAKTEAKPEVKPETKTKDDKK